jgi:diguanylate cyclase (GGDEF)-like protein/putative nucleotidyltransferase with HDIG domain
MDETKLFWFRIGALLHDVGKLMLPEEVLNKPGKLVDAEWQLMQRHTTAGVEMLAGIEFPWHVRPIIESHHERWDGRGYPHGLAREEIPLTARILCVADVYDALVSKRSYKRALTHDEAMELMRRDVGHVFDPIIFAQFEEVAREWVARLGHHSAEPLAPSDAGDEEVDAAGARAASSDVDGVTRLPTRRAFFAEAAKALYDGIREGRPLSLLVVDVDRFKEVNEQYGHLQGDDVLRRIADLLRHHTRGGDFVARYAGDEFIVLLPNTPPNDGLALAERLRNAAEAALFPLRSSPDESLRLTLSIGCATAPQQGQTVDSLLAAADSALYQVKRRGRATAGTTTGSMTPIAPPMSIAPPVR